MRLPVCLFAGEVIVAVVTQSQPIAGVSAGLDRIIEIIYPSVAATWPGRIIGKICDSLPVRVAGVKLSCILFGLPLAPAGAALYLLTKVTGDRYLLTNRGVEIRKSIGGRLIRRVDLSQIAAVTIRVVPGQAFHKAGDIELRDAKGALLATLAGVSRPERFQSAVMEARHARVHNDAALAQIQARK